MSIIGYLHDANNRDNRKHSLLIKNDLFSILYEIIKAISCTLLVHQQPR